MYTCNVEGITYTLNHLLNFSVSLRVTYDAVNRESGYKKKPNVSGTTPMAYLVVLE